VSGQQTIKPGAGNPREPVPVLLEYAREQGIRQVLGKNGELIGDLPDPELPETELKRMYEAMCLTRAIDERGWVLQRSGRIAFWIPLRGQEAIAVGTTCASNPEDWVFRAHREMAVWLLRGKPLDKLFAQFFGAEDEPMKGRRLPCLIGSRDINLFSTATPVGCFLPHAIGAAWAAKLKGSSERVICFTGDGSASRGEFHSALNFAGIHKPPAIIVLANNGWAVTTPLDCQTAQQNFAAKADAYAVNGVRVDGNDPLAIYAIVKQSLDSAHEQGTTLIEAITYRQGFHTSSDNPDLYRKEEELENWRQWDPINRLRAYMEGRGCWSEAEESAMAQQQEADIQAAVTKAESMPLPGPESQFDDIFEASNWMLDEQRARVLSELETGANN